MGVISNHGGKRDGILRFAVLRGCEGGDETLKMAHDRQRVR